MPDDITPWNWMIAVRDVVGNMDWWLDNPELNDRVPKLTVGYPLGWLDECDCNEGQALVTAGEVFYTGDRFPDQDLQDLSFDSNDIWAVNITLEYARCRPTATEARPIPPNADRLEFAEGLYADGQAIWRALRCAAPGWRTTGPGRAVVRGWGPILRDIGRCAGFKFDLTCRLNICEPCPTA